MATVAQPATQAMEALDRANEIRLARAQLRRELYAGTRTAASVILDGPVGSESWELGDMLMAQRRWGPRRLRRFLGVGLPGEHRRIGTLTIRERQELARRLERT